MNILYYSPWDESYMAQWQRFQIFNELEHYDVHFEVFNPWDYPSYEAANESLIKRLKDDKSIDLFVNCSSSEMLMPEAMQLISGLPVPKVLVCYDNLHAPYMHKDIAPYFDLVWLTSWETEIMFKKWGCNTIFLPYASNPYAFKDAFQKQIDRVCFIGTPYGTRTITFNHLAQNRIDVDVFCKSVQTTKPIERQTLGSQYPPIKDIMRQMTFPIGRRMILGKIKSRIQKPKDLLENNNLRLLDKVSFEDMNKAYSDYALSLNIIALRNTAVLKHPVQKIHLRTFEIPMACGLELVEYNEELSNYFTNDEMVFYTSKEEMVDKARFYTDPKNASLCRQMKLNAREKAASEHGWINRYSVIFDKIGLKYNSKPDVQAI